jgi:hypothetical protein
VQRCDVDLIARHAEATVKIARETGSGVVARQLHGLQPQLAAFLSNRAVRDLNDQIMGLARTSGI